MSNALEATATQEQGVFDPATLRRGEDQDHKAAQAFKIFAFLWAGASLFHYAAYPADLVGVGAFLLLIAAIAVLLRPSSLLRFTVLTVLQVAVVADAFPAGVSNHWLFTFFVSATFLLTLAYLALSKKPSPAKPQLFFLFAPVVRVELIVLYFFAVLHKLNADFFNPDLSCATAQYLQIASSSPWLPTGEWMLSTLAYVTIVVEVAIPLLLLFRQTRVAGVMLGALFHFALALNPEGTFYDFTSMLYAVYFLFIPYDYVSSLKRHWGSTTAGMWFEDHVGLLKRTFRAFLFLIAVVLTCNFLYQAFSRQPVFVLLPGLPEAMQAANIFVWAAYGAVLLAIFGRAAWQADIVGAVRGLDRIAIPRLVLVIPPLLLLLNGLSPYVGLKTEHSFSMFSNLQTEGLRSNHFFMPVHFRVAPYQDDLVYIVDTSVPHLQELVDEGHKLPYLELRRRIHRRKNDSITYVRNGVTKEVARIGDDLELSAPLSFWQKKFLRFRPVDTNEAGVRCSH